MTVKRTSALSMGAAFLLLVFTASCGGGKEETTPSALPPNGTITAPAADATINPGQTVTFAGSATDPGGNALTVLWDFGDGSTSTVLAPGDHAYAAVGTYTATFTATNSLGLADPTPASRLITVQTAPVNQAPSGTITAPAANVSITPGQSVSFSGTATDPNGDPVTVLWDFGDGSATSTVLAPGNHTYAAAGTYTVTFTATDSFGLADPTPATRTITVSAVPVNQAPNGTISTPAANVTITAGQAVSFSGTATDPDGNTPVTVLWNFGDGTATSTALAPGNHTYAAAGTYTVTFTATDALGLADPTPATRTITVSAVPVNQAPNGTITAPAANVSITAGSAVSFAGTATDPDGNTPVTVLWNFGDGSATSTLLTPGNHTYAVAGTYTVTFTATDSLGLADPTPATRTITVTAAAATFTQVQAIFTASCTGCHGAGGSAGLNLTAGNAYANLVNVPATTAAGVRVAPGNPSASRLSTFLASGHRSVSAANQDIINSWITAGALNN